VTHTDATAAVLAVACTHCGRGLRERCHNPAGRDCYTHAVRWKAAGLEPPKRVRYGRKRRPR
jgi:hypothetical protein